MRAWFALLPFTVTVPADRLDQVADHAQERRLPAARRPDQRDELARREREVDVLERGDVPARERLRHAVELDDVARCVGHADVLRRAVHERLLGNDDDDEEDDAEQRGDDVRRPELLRLDASSTG